MSVQPQAITHAYLILDILQRIPRRRFTTSTHLHEQLQAAGHPITRRTLQRQLDAIVQHFPIECDTRGKPFGYRWLDGAQGLSLPLLAPAEALLLQLAHDEVAQLLPRRTMRSVAPLFASARQQLNDRDAPSAHERRWLGKVQRIPESLPLLAPKINADVLETVSEALYQERSLHLHYRNAHHQRKQAHVWPLALVQQGNRLYLVCRFDGYANERILALPRIQQAQTGLPFSYPDDFDLDTYIAAGHFGILRAPLMQLEFRIAKAHGMHLAESPLSADQQLTEEPDCLHIRATVPDTELLQRWLRSWGDAIWDIHSYASEPQPTGG